MLAPRCLGGGLVRWVLFAAAVLFVDIHSECPVVPSRSEVWVSEDDLQSSRAPVRFATLFVNTQPLGVPVVLNLSVPVVATVVTTADLVSGLAGRESPQGFFYRYRSRLSTMILSGALVQILGATSTSVNLSFAWTFDQLQNFDIGRDEYLSLAFQPAFFGIVNESLCNSVIPFGAIRVVSSASGDGYMAFTLVTTFVSMIATGVFGWHYPGKAIDAQTLVALSMTSCAEPHPKVLMGSYRFLAPFALSEDLGGMLAGNSIAIAGAWLIGWMAAIVVGKRRGAKTMEEAGSHVLFPRIPFLFMMALYQGTVFSACRLFAQGVVSSSGGQLAGGIVATVGYVLVIPCMTWVYVNRGILGEFHEYRTENLNRFWKFFAPSGVWLPVTVRRSGGGVVQALQRPERIFALLAFASPISTAIVFAPEVTAGSSCFGQYLAFLLVQMILVVAIVWFTPFRSRMECVYACLSHVVLSCCGALYATSLQEEVTTIKLYIPQCILLSLSWLRLGNDALVSLVDHSGIPLGARLFYWHDGTRGALENAYEVKDRHDDDLFPDAMLQQQQQDDSGATAAPVPSPLSHLPSMVRPNQPSSLSEILSNAPPPKKAPSLLFSSSSGKGPDDDFDDPFASEDDDPLGLEKKPSKLKSPNPSLTRKPSHALDSDEDPFADSPPKPTPAPEQEEPASQSTASKLKGFAKKLMLASKFKKGVDDVKQQKEQHEMFGDMDDLDPLRRGLKKGGGAATTAAPPGNEEGDINDLLGLTAANPMSQLGGAGAFNQPQGAAPAKKVAGGDFSYGVPSVPAKKPEAEIVDTVAVYRVEFSPTQKRLALVAQDLAEFGSFVDGDSYVVLNPKPAKSSGGYSKEIFVWIGKVSTPDEIKAAVTEATALDNQFPTSFVKQTATGGNKITRIVQDAETTNFTSLFPGQQIKIIEGGVDSEGGQQGRLYHVHGQGARKMNLTLVPPSVDSLDDGDVFVFDCGAEVYIFQGTECSPFEKEHGRQYAEKLRSSRAQCVVTVVDQNSAPEKFWKALGTTRKAAVGMTLRRLESFLPSQINRLWIVKGPNEFKMEASGDDVCFTSLKSEHVMVVDLCSVVFLWVGSKCPHYQEQRDNAIHRGVEYLKKHSDNKIPLIRVLENFEGDTFKDLVPEAPVDL